MLKLPKQYSFKPKLLSTSLILSALLSSISDIVVPMLHTELLSIASSSSIVIYVIVAFLATIAIALLLSYLLSLISVEKDELRSFKGLVIGVFAILVGLASIIAVLSLLVALLAVFFGYIEILPALLQLALLPLLLNTLLVFGSSAGSLRESLSVAMKRLRKSYFSLLLCVLGFELLSWLIGLLPFIVSFPLHIVLGTAAFYCAVDILPRWLR